MPRLRSGLSPRVQEFVLEYLKSWNGADAAIKVGYAPKAAAEQASRLLALAKVRQAIEAVQNKALTRVEASVVRVIAEYVALAFFDPATLFAEDGTLKPLSEMEQSARRCIAGIEVEELWEGSGEARRQIGRLKKIKIIQKTEALKALGTHLKMFVDRDSENPSVTVNVLVSDEEAGKILNSLATRMARQLPGNGNGNGSDSH